MSSSLTSLQNKLGEIEIGDEALLPSGRRYDLNSYLTLQELAVTYPEFSPALRAFDSVYAIRGRGKDSDVTYGTGAFISANFFLTCAHVMNSRISGSFIAQASSTDISLSSFAIEAKNDELDYCILSSRQATRTTVQGLIPGDPADYLADFCVLYGCPQIETLGRPKPPAASYPVTSLGVVSVYDQKTIKIHAPTINPGFSGGLALSRDGRALGIISAQYGSGGEVVRLDAILEDVLKKY